MKPLPALQHRTRSVLWSGQHISRSGAPPPAKDVVTEWQLHDFLFVVPVLCLENTFSPAPDGGRGVGAAKIEDIPPYCTRTLYTGPPGRGRRGSWHILGSLFPSGRVVRVTSHVRVGTLGGHLGPGSWSRCFLVLGPFLVPPPAPVPAQRHVPYLARPPPPSWPLMAPRLPGLSVFLPAWRSRGRLWLLRDSRALSLVLTQGKGCVWQKQLYKYGCRGRLLLESLGEFADDTNQGCVLHPGAAGCQPEGQTGPMRGKTGQPGGPGQAGTHGRPRLSVPSSPLAFTFSSSSSSLPSLQGPALLE